MALRFKPEDPCAALPAIANLATGDAAGCIMATFITDENSTKGSGVPTFAARSPAAIGADVEAAPVIDHSHHRRRRLRVGTGSEIRGRGGGRHPQCSKTYRSQQQFLHRNSLNILRIENTFPLEHTEFHEELCHPDATQLPPRSPLMGWSGRAPALPATDAGHRAPAAFVGPSPHPKGHASTHRALRPF